MFFKNLNNFTTKRRLSNRIMGKKTILSRSLTIDKKTNFTGVFMVVVSLEGKQGNKLLNATRASTIRRQLQ